ncbi:MAG: hypothetical protein ACLRTI_05525 [Blautia sp.]
MMNKKRLAALALSAVMAASTMSFPVYAADFSDGATITEAAPAVSAFTSDVEVQTAEPVEETAPAVGDTNGKKVNKDSVTFWYNDKNHKDFEVTYKLENDGTEYSVMANPDDAEYKKANCENYGQVRPKVTILGEEFESKIWFDIPTQPPLTSDRKHDYDIFVKTETTKFPTHWTEGTEISTYKCSRCEAQTERFKVLPKQPHTLESTVYYVPTDEKGNPTADPAECNVKVDEDGFVVMEDGHAVLIEKDKDGYFETRTYCSDPICKDMIYGVHYGDLRTGYYVEANKVELAQQAYKAVIEKQSPEIETNLVGREFFYPTVSLPLVEESEIELKDCRVGGTYTVAYYTKDGKRISDEVVNVAPHHYHVYHTAVFANWKQANQCDVKTNKDGSISVTNNSCYLSVDYTDVEHCSAKGCYGYEHKLKTDTVEKPNCKSGNVLSMTAKTAAPAGKHVINTDAKKEIAFTVAWYGRYLTYADLLDVIKSNKYDEYVKLSAAPDCEAGGTVTVSYICMVDKKEVVETQDIKVYPTDHTRAVPTREEKVDIVEPTCNSNGSYTAVVKCDICGKEIERRENVKIPRLPHTNEKDKNNEDNATAATIYEDDIYTDKTAYLKFVGDKVIDFNGETVKDKANAPFTMNNTDPTKVMQCVGTYATKDDPDVFRDAFGVSVKVYTNCDECGHNEVALASQADVKLTVVDVQKEGANGKAGSITLKATYRTSEKKTIEAEYTVPYFSTIEAYNARLEEQPETPGSKINGLHLDSDGVWRYYKDSVLQSDYTGFVDYAGRTFYVINGKLDQTLTRLIIFDNEWYYLIEGELTNYTGVVLYDGEWFYVSKGRLDDTINGLVEYNGGLFVFVDGRLADESNGMWISNDNKAYWTALGRVCEEYTGVAMYDNAFFYVIDGKVAQDYNGTVEYNGATFRVENGQLYGPIK